MSHTWDIPDSNSSGFSPLGFTILALELNMAFLQRKRTFRLSPCVCHLFQTQPGLSNPATQPHAPKLNQRTPHGPGQPQHVVPGGAIRPQEKSPRERGACPPRGSLQGPGSPRKRHHSSQSPTSRPTGEPHSWALLLAPAPSSRGSPPAERGGKPRQPATPGPGRPDGHRTAGGR